MQFTSTEVHIEPVVMIMFRSVLGKGWDRVGVGIGFGLGLGRGSDWIGFGIG